MTDVDALAREMAGNWRRFKCFVWDRRDHLPDADRWAVYYTTGRDAGLLAQSNHAEIAKRVAPFMEGEDANVVIERHFHWAVGYLNGFSIRVFKPDGSVTPAFEELHRIREALDDYPSLVGQSEANLRQALRTIDAMAPAICMVDEQLEKALSGVGSVGDSGASTRLFGNLLTYLSDHESDVFFVATSNDISKLPPELARAERFDGVFFLDLPATKEKDRIWAIYREQYEIPDNQARPDDTSWTGAEIKSCCRLSALLEVPLTQAARNVVPVAVTSSESIERLRTWASGRCLSASTPGVYSREGEQPVRARRVNRGPANN